MLTEIITTNEYTTELSVNQNNFNKINKLYNIAGDLEVVGDNLLSLIQTTEKDFLKIGSEISQFSTGSFELSELIKQTTGIISGKDMEIIIIQLEEMLARINRYMVFNSEELNSKLNILEHILDSINNNSTPLKDLTRLVMELRMLGISTRIESARLSDGNNSFNALSNDVNNLSDIVSDKLDNIKRGLSSSRLLLEKVIEKITQFKSQQAGFAHAIIDRLVECLKNLKMKHANSIQSITRINDENFVISNGVGEIVSSLQFHDIARQKIEHVKEALDSLILQFENNYAENNANNYETDIITMIHDVCELQVNQLDSTRFEVIHAGENLINNETRIASISRNMVKNTWDLLQSSDENKESFCNNTEKSIESIKDSLYENARINFELNSSINHISEMSRELVVFIKDIKLIGKRITLIALNAIINAEHLNQEGAALSILAEGIQQLADVTKEHIMQIAENMNDITNNAKDLLGGKTAIEQKDTIENVVNEMMGDFGNLINSLHKLFDTVTQQLTQIEIKGKAFLSDMESSIQCINVHKIFDQSLKNSIISLNKILSVCGGLTPGINNEKKVFNVSSMNKNYTMESERKIHKSYLLDDKEKSKQNHIQPAMATDNSFGDNVELF